jgi:hypothetical protein
MSLSPAQVVPARSWSTTSPTGAGSATWSCHGRWCLVTLSGELTWRTAVGCTPPSAASSKRADGS